MINDIGGRKYDLEERTQVFGEKIIELCKSIPQNNITRSIINQLVRSGTSVGSNYCEADCAESKKDFVHKFGICNKEANETKYWLRMISKVGSVNIEEARRLWQEAHELNLILITIIRKTRENMNN